MRTASRKLAKAGAAALRRCPFLLGFLFYPAGPSFAQAIAVLPVNVRMDAGQAATALTIINKADVTTSYQVRGYTWSQPNGVDETDPTDSLMISPPLGTMAPGATQIVRLVLRKPTENQEETYRVFVDQIPPPAAGGTVRIALRLSIPVFAEPTTHVAPHIKWHAESGSPATYLVAVNDGNRHETVHKMSLALPDGTPVKIAVNASPYILAGATRKWPIQLPRSAGPGTVLHLSMQGEVDTVDEQIPVSASP